MEGIVSIIEFVIPNVTIKVIKYSGSILNERKKGTNNTIVFGWIPGINPKKTPQIIPARRNRNNSFRLRKQF